jgi:ribosomal protein S8
MQPLNGITAWLLSNLLAKPTYKANRIYLNKRNKAKRKITSNHSQISKTNLISLLRKMELPWVMDIRGLAIAIIKLTSHKIIIKSIKELIYVKDIGDDELK